jgi:CheY-like chemotaxis protein
LDSISSSTAAPSILIVEDDAPSREAVTHAPTQAGYEVVPASSGEDALDLIAAEFDGLLCAIERPGRADGWEVGASSSFIWPDRPVIYVSAIAAPQPRLENLTAVRIKSASSFVYLS